MQDVQKIARDRFALFDDAKLLEVSLERDNQLVTVLFYHEADQLLHTKREYPARQRRSASFSACALT